MILALFTDIHSNREAFEACLSDAATRGAQKHVFLGDLVGYGSEPSFVVETVSRLMEAGAVAVKGNHDLAVTAPLWEMNGYARAAIEWTKEHLNEREKEFLKALPLLATLGDALFVHGDASKPESWIYVMGAAEAERSMKVADRRITFTGHVHRPQLASMPLSGEAETRSLIPAADIPYHLDVAFKWHAVIGSVGQPRDEDPRAAYALYDEETATLTFVRVAYDIAAAAAKIRAAGLPPVLADRLFLGR